MTTTRLKFEKHEDTPDPLVLEHWLTAPDGKLLLGSGYVLFRKGHTICMDVHEAMNVIVRLATADEIAFMKERLSQFGINMDEPLPWHGLPR